MATETAPENTVSQDDSATIPSLIVSNFFTGATPLFEKLADLSAFAQVQYSYYASMGVGQPLLGPYEAMGRGFAETEEFAAVYGALSDDFVATAYNDVFGRAPSETQAAHFQAQVDYFAGIYVQAGLAADAALMLAKGAAIGQMLGEAAINGTATFDYYGAAEAFIAQMDDEDFVPGQPLANFDDAPVVTPPAGGGGGGGGGGGPSPDTVEYSFKDGVLTLSSAGAYSATVSGADLRLVEPDGQVRSVELSAITKIELVQSGTRLNVDGAAVHDRTIAVDGDGVLNVTGIEFSLSTGKRLETNRNLDNLIRSSRDTVDSSDKFIVNGNKGDAIRVLWDYFDDIYYSIPGNMNNLYHDGPFNLELINLGLRYVDLIESDKDSAVFDIIETVSKDGVITRQQTMHDSILGKLDNDASLNSRTGVTADMKNIIPAEYRDRGYVSGKVDEVSAAAGEAKAFDFKRGFERSDYEVFRNKVAIDASGQNAGYMVVGNSMSANGFDVDRHEGLGVEVALKAKVREGDDLSGVHANGVTTFNAHSGYGPDATWGKPATWSFDFSVLTGLNGVKTKTDLSDFDFKLSIDLDIRKDETEFLELALKVNQDRSVEWVDSSGAVFITDGGGDGIKLSQDSVNLGFFHIHRLIDGDRGVAGFQQYKFGQGEFDIKLEAFEKGGVNLIGSSHIVVDVV